MARPPAWTKLKVVSKMNNDQAVCSCSGDMEGTDHRDVGLFEKEIGNVKQSAF